MIIPSVDIQDGQCVQLIGGAKCAIRAGDPEPWVKRFSTVNEVAVIDIDAATGRGSNRNLIETLVKNYPCRVGGGIRDLATAKAWLNLGARKIIIGTAAEPDLLSKLPRERTIVALDALNGEVQQRGWTEGTGRNINDEVARLSPYVSEFLITTIEREGRMCGLDLEGMNTLLRKFPGIKFTVAGGVNKASEIAIADEVGVDVQTGMAIYTGQMRESDVLIEILKQRSSQELWPTVVADESGAVLGLVYSNAKSLEAALDQKRGVYWSRRRGIWVKGAQSGNTQELLNVSMGCERNSLKFIVKQNGSGFCHKDQRSCFGSVGEFEGFQDVKARIDSAIAIDNPSSYTRFLINNPEELNKKIVEESVELADTSPNDREEVLHEFCDLFYFSYLKLRAGGLTWADAERNLMRRTLKVSRRFKPKGEQRAQN